MKVLLADDNREHLDLLQYIFQREGYEVSTASDGNGAWLSFQNESPDLLVLDMQMPKRSGIDVLRAVRSKSRVPVMMLTVLADEESVVRALEFGADDYVTKPFRPAELRARARALLRRMLIAQEEFHTFKHRLVCDDLILDSNTRQVTVADAPVQLTPTEFSLLHYLMLNSNMVVRTGAILENVWGYDADETDDVVRVSISRLRKKIEADPSNPQYILNSPGVGYMLSCQVH